MQPRTLELNTWTSEKKCRAVVAALAGKHFTAVYCETAQEAADYILRQAETAQTVGFGGSLSVADLKLTSVLAGQGKAADGDGKPQWFWFAMPGWPEKPRADPAPDGPRVVDELFKPF